MVRIEISWLIGIHIWTHKMYLSQRVCDDFILLTIDTKLRSFYEVSDPVRIFTTFRTRKDELTTRVEGDEVYGHIILCLTRIRVWWWRQSGMLLIISCPNNNLKWPSKVKSSRYIIIMRTNHQSTKQDKCHNGRTSLFLSSETILGIDSPQCILNAGSTILSLAGKFNPMRNKYCYWHSRRRYYVRKFAYKFERIV